MDTRERFYRQTVAEFVQDNLSPWLWADEQQTVRFNKQWALKKYKFAA